MSSQQLPFTFHARYGAENQYYPTLLQSLLCFWHTNSLGQSTIIKVAAVNFTNMTSLKLKEFKPRGSLPASLDVTSNQKTTKTSLLGTLSWFLAGSSLVFLIIVTLLIANGSCSQPRGLSASSPVCLGGQLSMQSWLAIVGVEFTILGLVVIPRFQAVLISKILTRKLTHGGLPLAKLLNSQTNSSSWTKLRLGLKSTLFIRIFTFMVVIVVSICYKFSFVLVGRVDTVALKGAKAPINMGCDGTGNCNGVSSNFIDAMSASNSSSSFNITVESTTSSTPKHYYQVFGPSQDNIAQQLSSGNLSLCIPTYYS
jgi:hypothetical protein